MSLNFAQAFEFLDILHKPHCHPTGMAIQGCGFQVSVVEGLADNDDAKPSCAHRSQPGLESICTLGPYEIVFTIVEHVPKLHRT